MESYWTPENIRCEARRLVQIAISEGQILEGLVAEIERSYLAEILRFHRGNHCAAATRLRMHRNTLSRKMDALGISRREGKPAKKAAAR